MTSRLWKPDSNTKTAFGEVLRFPLWAFSERSRINPLQAQSLAFPLSGVSLRGLSLYELCQLWQIVIFVAFGGNVASLKFKSILPRWHWQRVQTLLKEPVWTKILCSRAKRKERQGKEQRCWERKRKPPTKRWQELLWKSSIPWTEKSSKTGWSF